MYLTINYKNIKVSYSWRLNGGGIILAHEFVRIISKRIGKVDHVFEYCAGPGFIGFALLANNLCDRLTLADVNPKAIKAIKETIKNNNLQDKVTVYQSDCLDSIPKAEQWDLVVSNPPWYLCSGVGKNLMVYDPESRVHEKFYRNINKFLKPNGLILFMEGGEYTNSICFKGMIENNGLRITESFSPVKFLEILKDMDGYGGLNIPAVIFLRFILFIRQCYFIWSKRNERFPGKSSNINTSNQGVMIHVAKKQKLLYGSFLGLLSGYLLRQESIGAVILPVFSICAVPVVFQSVLSLKKKRHGLYIFCSVIPILNLITLLELAWESAKVLKANK